MLTYQILLTRVSALRLFFHFGFLVISNCLLGIGAAGSMITLFQERWRQQPRFWTWVFSTLYFASLGLAYAFALSFEIPADLRLLEVDHFLRFSAFNLVSAIPFFFAGTVVGLCLTFNAENVNSVYFADLVAAGLGCLLCPLLLWSFGAGGTLVFVVLMALVAAVASAPVAQRRSALALGLALGVAGLWAMPRLDGWFPVPGKGSLMFTKNQGANLTEISEYSKWSSNSRVDLLPVKEEARLLINVGDAARNLPLPDEKFIVQDGSAGTMILDWTRNPEMLEAIRLSMYGATFAIKEKPRVFIIGVGGGNDVWAAKVNDASRVKGIELNGPILEIHRTVLPEWSRGITEDPRIELVHGEGRAALMADTDSYDVVQMTGIDTWTALSSGAYMLAENYLYTTEAIKDMYDHLVDGGMIQMVRIGLAMESLRLISNVDAALKQAGAPPLEDSIAYLRTKDHFFGVIVKKGAFTEQEISALETWCEEAGIEPVYLPGRNIESKVDYVTKFILETDKQGFIERFPRNISPTTDDKPYFFNYSRWDAPLASTEFIREPTFISQGNPFFILAQLAVSALLALAFIVAPLLLTRHRAVDRTHAGRFFVYFLGLGAGFIGIEVALMQKLTLFLGHPLYSITVTLFAILIFTGTGSLISARWFERSGSRTTLIPVGIAALLGVFLVVSPVLTGSLMGLPLSARIAITIALLAPVSLLMGVPLAYGIRLLNRLNPTLVPWAWAVNACFTVVGSILTVILSMNLGFDLVLLFSMILYGVSFAALPADRATAPEASLAG
jgi:hypothetical protein